MAAGLLFANNANSTLVGTLSASSTSITLALGGGSQFPALSSGQTFTGSLINASTESIFEIVEVTARSGDVLTVVRGQEGTTAVSWLVGDLFSNNPTAGQMAAMLQSSHNVGQQSNGLTSTYLGAAYNQTISVVGFTAPCNGKVLCIGNINFSNVGSSAVTFTTNATGCLQGGGLPSVLPQTQQTTGVVSSGAAVSATMTITTSTDPGIYASAGLTLSFDPLQ